MYIFLNKIIRYSIISVCIYTVLHTKLNEGIIFIEFSYLGIGILGPFFIRHRMPKYRKKLTIFIDNHYR